MSASVEDAPHFVQGSNDQFNWGWEEEGIFDYIKRNYEWPSKQDVEVASGVIGRIAMLPPSYFGSLGSLRDIGTNGVLRTGLLEPLLDEKAAVCLTDVSNEPLTVTRSMVAAVAMGTYATVVWGRHEVAMAKQDRRWLFAVRGICVRGGRLADTRQQNLWELPPESTEAATEGHVLCSSTNDREEYMAGVKAFYDQLVPGGVAMRLYMIQSTGYKVGDRFYPAISITPDDIEEEAEAMNMRVIGGAFGVKADPHAPGGARDKKDPTSYAGFGGAALLKPPRRSGTVMT